MKSLDEIMKQKRCDLWQIVTLSFASVELIISAIHFPRTVLCRVPLENYSSRLKCHNFITHYIVSRLKLKYFQLFLFSYHIKFIVRSVLVQLMISEISTQNEPRFAFFFVQRKNVSGEWERLDQVLLPKIDCLFGPVENRLAVYRVCNLDVERKENLGRFSWAVLFEHLLRV